jgi:uncharacterized protein
MTARTTLPLNAFACRRVVLPVIHVDTLEQARRNARIAREAGTHGVFLINHGITDQALLDVHAAVADEQPGWWVGVNCLGMSPEAVFRAIPTTVGGVWVDHAGIDESQDQQPFADRVLAVRDARVPRCLYFGGVAFKYQRPVSDLEAACRVAARYMDVVTTSGAGTGTPAEVEKIRRMRRALGDTPLGIASGITPENVGDYLPHADFFLVATGISRSFLDLDPSRVAELVRRVDSDNGSGVGG